MHYFKIELYRIFYYFSLSLAIIENISLVKSIF